MTEDQRAQAIELVNEAQGSGARLALACELIGITERTLQRWKKDGLKDKRQMTRKAVPNKLTPKEREAVVKIATSKTFCDLSPNEIVPCLADQGVYIASESTFYRILREEKMLAHRRRSKLSKYKKPACHIARNPNEVWSWDITYLPSRIRGQYYYLYMIVDIYSRKIVGYSVHHEELSEHSGRLLRQAYESENVVGKRLVLHSDNGVPMKGSTMLATMQDLGVTKSFSRPSVSNDNPYSEALFRTIKYDCTYPEKNFASIEEARKWVDRLVDWYNNRHRHSKIKYVTPHQRHNEEDKLILKKRKEVYRKAKESNPKRWSRGTRNWEHVNMVLLNPTHSAVRQYEMLIEQTKLAA